MATSIVFLIFYCFLNTIELNASSASNVFYVQHDQQITYNPLTKKLQNRDQLQIYCYEGKPKYIIYIWQSVILQLDLPSDNYIHYVGSTPEAVENEYLEHRSSWSLNLFSWKLKHFQLDPFKQSCLGIKSSEQYTIFLHLIRIDYWKIILLSAGIFLFISAPKLSNNAFFYYVCGISLGMCASFLILIYFISKLFPRRPLMYGVVVGGWAVGVYVLQMLWENLHTILVNYKSYVAWYAAVSGLISFIVCYRFGTVTNQRTKNLIRWTLQLAGMAAVFFSSQFREAAMGQVVLLVLLYNFPRVWITKSKTMWNKRFPPKVKLLSNDQYYQQGVQETEKALGELKQYCSSPECNQWKTVLKLKDVKRFASFMEGNSHLTDEEILEYESDGVQEPNFTDDEEDLTD